MCALMPIGGPMPANINLAESGFTIADNITILGMNIKADLSNLLDCHNLAIEKIRKIIAFWQRFNLSLLGRIGITKNLLLYFRKSTISAALLLRTWLSLKLSPG